MYSSSFLTTSRTDLAPHIGIISISVATPRHKNTTNQGPRNRWLVSPWWDSQGISRKKIAMGSSPRYQRLKYGGLRMVKIIQLVDMALFLQKSWKDRENIKDQGWTKQKLWQLPFFKSVPGHLWDPKSLSHEKHPYPIQWIPSISTMTHGLVGDLYI